MRKALIITALLLAGCGSEAVTPISTSSVAEGAGDVAAGAVEAEIGPEYPSVVTTGLIVTCLKEAGFTNVQAIPETHGAGAIYGGSVVTVARFRTTLDAAGYARRWTAQKWTPSLGPDGKSVIVTSLKPLPNEIMVQIRTCSSLDPLTSAHAPPEAS